MKNKLLIGMLSLTLAIASIGMASIPTYAAEVTETETTTTTTESEYKVKEISKIYTPKSIDGTRLVSQMRDFMCTKDGVVDKTIGFGIGLPAEQTNEENYKFNIMTYKDDFTYTKEIDVEILPFDNKMGFVMFEDGDIAVLFNCQEEFTYSDIVTGINAFLEYKDITAVGLDVPNQSFYSTKTYEGSYTGGKLYVVCSGVNIYYTSPTQPTDETKEKEGYVGMDRLVYTSDFTREQALNIVKDQLLLYNGVLVEDYTVTFTEKENSNYVTVEYTKNGESLLKDSIYCKQIESTYSYVFVRPYGFDYGYVAISKQESNLYSLNTFMADLIKTFRTLLGDFSNEATIDFTKLSKVDVDGVYRIGNGSYYSYEYNVEIIDAVTTNKEDNPEVGTPPSDDSNITTDILEEGKTNLIDEFKKNFEENNAFKAATLVIGSITGIALIWGIWILIRKLIKWFRK